MHGCSCVWYYPPPYQCLFYLPPLCLTDSSFDPLWKNSIHLITFLKTNVFLRLRGVTGKFFWGGKVVFHDFFPGRKYPFWLTQNKFQGFLKVESKKKKKVLSSFCNFSSHFQFFHLPFFNFPSFFPIFSFFSLAFLFLIGQQKGPLIVSVKISPCTAEGTS